MAPRSGVETKLNVRTQLQTFPHPTISNPHLWFQRRLGQVVLSNYAVQERVVVVTATQAAAVTVIPTQAPIQVRQPWPVALETDQ